MSVSWPSGFRIEAVFETDDLLPWNDFINRLRGEHAEPRSMAGRFSWQGRMTGAPARAHLFRPREIGEARYESLLWDAVEGDLTYWPDGFRLQRGTARRGPSSAQFELSMLLDRHFDEDTAWNFEATLGRTDTDGLQAVLGWSYPVHGLLSGTFHGGDRASSEMRVCLTSSSPKPGAGDSIAPAAQIALRRGGSHCQCELRRALRAHGALTSARRLLPAISFTIRAMAKSLSIAAAQSCRSKASDASSHPGCPSGGQMSFRLEGDGPFAGPQDRRLSAVVNLRLGSAGKLPEPYHFRWNAAHRTSGL